MASILSRSQWVNLAISSERFSLWHKVHTIDHKDKRAHAWSNHKFQSWVETRQMYYYLKNKCQLLRLLHDTEVLGQALKHAMGPTFCFDILAVIRWFCDWSHSSLPIPAVCFPYIYNLLSKLDLKFDFLIPATTQITPPSIPLRQAKYSLSIL